MAKTLISGKHSYIKRIEQNDGGAKIISNLR